MNLPEAQSQLLKLQPYKNVHDNPDVQRWVEEMNDTLVDIEDALMSGNVDSEKMRGHLAMMGMEPPKSAEEQLRLYTAFRLMLGFMKRKLSLLETQSSNYDKTKRKILELGRQDDIGTRRSVASR